MADHSAEFTQVTAGGIRWQVPRGYLKELLTQEGLLLDDWLKSGQATVVRDRPQQSVYRVTLDGLDFYLKRYRPLKLWAWVREFFRPSKARIEYQQALAVAACRMPTSTPLAVGEQCNTWGPGDSFLITRTVSDTEALSTFVEKTLPGLGPATQARLRLRLATALGRLLARMHDAGIAHDDLHPGNILIHLAPDGHPHLYLIDLYSVRVREPLRWRGSRNNLVLLNRWFLLRSSPADRLRFWRAYCAARQEFADFFRPAGRDRALILRLVARTWASKLELWRRRDRRYLSSNREVYPLRAAACAGHAATAVDPQELAALLAAPDEPFGRPGVTVCDDAPNGQRVEFGMQVGGRVCQVVYQRFPVPAWWAPFAALLRPARALRKWTWGHGLLERGLPTPRPLAVFHRRKGGLRWEGYLLTEKVQGAVTLTDLMAALHRRPPAARRAAIRHGVERVAWLLRELHQRHLVHRNLGASNILLATPPDRPAAPPPAQVWLLGVSEVAFRRKLPRRWQQRDLAQLLWSLAGRPLLSRTDKCRFLRLYLRRRFSARREDWKLWWRAIERLFSAPTRDGTRRDERAA